MAQIPAVSQVFRAADAPAVGRSVAKVTTVGGGVLQRAMQTMRTSAVWTNTIITFSVPTTMRKKGVLFVASGIRIHLAI
jgi:hypothetical protein